ncbi:MAG: alkaline phosphatase family protein [bacterium]|nr:alkaline phosphatase family protein [bacterium]
MKKNIFLYHTIITLLSFFSAEALNKPRLTIIIVVDQFAQDYIQKIKPYLKHGLRELISNGVYYPNAYMPHAMPATGPGHTALNTGTYAKDHGIVLNEWVNEQGKNVICDGDSAENAAVFSPTGTYNYGRSARLIMIDGLSDQFMLHSTEENPRYVFALSLKSRSAIGSASKLGKAIWFDEKEGLFTSSKAYFEELPAWIKTFNTTQGINELDHVFWHQAKPSSSRAYQFVNPKSYEFIIDDAIRVGQSIPIEREAKPDEPFHLFVQTPQANKLLFDLARKCIQVHCNKQNNTDLLLWLDLSSLDKLGHIHGPDSKEVLDMIYHLDKQLACFMRFAQRTAGTKNTLFVLTADHGIAPIPEVVKQAGLPAVRIIKKDLIERSNAYLQKGHGIANAIYKFKFPQFFLNQDAFSLLSREKKHEILKDLQSFLQKQPGIKRAWTNKELDTQCFEPNSIENYFKQQRYPGRSGSLFIQVTPYSHFTKWEKGTSHRSPYKFDLHIPLVLYQRGSIELKTIGKDVSALQLANTLADILQIPRPSASTIERLPGLDEELDYLAR